MYDDHPTTFIVIEKGEKISALTHKSENGERDLMILRGICDPFLVSFAHSEASIDASYLSFTSISQPRGITNGGSKRVQQ